MVKLLPFEQIDAGGVDSRSNPINMPRNRALRCLNWVPKQAGFWELRYGYTSVSMSSVTASAISGMFPYRTWDGHKYVIFIQGTTFNLLDTATGIVTTPTMHGAAVASSVKGTGFFANNRFHYGNGTDQKWSDGANWRDSGLPTLTTAEVAAITVSEGVRELTVTQASTVTLTPAGGGSFPADTLTGHLIYVAIFDGTLNEIGPATIFVSSGRVTVTLNQKITVGNLPNLSSVNTNWVKLIGGTVDGGNIAYFFTNTSTAITSSTNTFPNNYIQVVSTGHGLSTGDCVVLAGTTFFDGVFQVTVVDANTFRVPLNGYVGNQNSTGGTCKRIVQAGNATTSVDVLAPTQDNTYQVNQNRGLAASVVGGPNAGYQFYASIYNQNGGGHIGNRVAIGPRALQTAYRSNWRIGGLPQLNISNDIEWQVLLGRTGDGALVPYIATDNAGNFAVVPTAGVNFTFVQPNLNGNLELPTRNGIIPSQCNLFAQSGDFCYAADTGSPFLRRSGSLADALAGIFAGRPEQSWAPDDINTFPTGEALTGIFEVDQEVVCGTLHDTAISVNLAGIEQWVGPWAVGLAGKRAGIKCGSHGFYWVTGDKQLATFQGGVPTAVSDEYELAELSQIGDSFLSTVEVSYFRSAALGKDELRISAQLQNGTPYTIIHDFKDIEYYKPPGSIYGQGYSSQFAGPLATAFTVAQVRDGLGKLQVYAGASTGQIYQLYAGADDAGTQYTADAILLLNGGPDRPNVPFVDFYGDQNISITVGRNLQTSLANGAAFGFEPPNADDNIAQSVQGSEQDFLYRVYLTPPEVQRLYLRFQLTSHSADGNLNLNSPVHVPLENYGRLYEFVPAVGDERDR